jgi:hypothetical protein
MEGLCDPEVARADYPPHRDAFPIRLRGPRQLNLPPPAHAFARLRIFEHRVLSVDTIPEIKAMLRICAYNLYGWPAITASGQPVREEQPRGLSG